MFATNYYTLVAGLREYTLDVEVKGFDAAAITAEVLESLTAKDALQVQLLATYYDCENLAARRAGRQVCNPLGNLTCEEIDEELRAPQRLPEALATVLRAYADPEGEDAETVDVEQRFERSLMAAYYDLCAAQGCRFLKAWSCFDRNLRNVTAAVTARAKGRAIDEVTVGAGDVVDQLQRSSAADFGLRGELGYIDALIAAVGEEGNILDKEHKIDLIRWNEALELSQFDYFDINAVLSYLVRIHLVARWAQLDAARGREMFARLAAELDGKELINK